MLLIAKLRIKDCRADYDEPGYNRFEAVSAGGILIRPRLPTMAENEQSMHLSIVLISDQMGPSRPLRIVRSCRPDAIDPEEVITAVAETVVKLSCRQDDRPHVIE